LTDILNCSASNGRFGYYQLERCSNTALSPADGQLLEFLEPLMPPCPGPCRPGSGAPSCRRDQRVKLSFDPSLERSVAGILLAGRQCPQLAAANHDSKPEAVKSRQPIEVELHFLEFDAVDYQKKFPVSSGAISISQLSCAFSKGSCCALNCGSKYGLRQKHLCPCFQHVACWRTNTARIRLRGETDCLSAPRHSPS